MRKARGWNENASPTKRCSCGREYGEHGLMQLPLAGHSCSAADETGPEEHLALLTCYCGSTFAVAVRPDHVGEHVWLVPPKEKTS